jgi:hypothetical protein
MDCPPNTGLISNANGLDVNTNPRGTGSYSLNPGVACTGPGLNVKRCIGGSSEYHLCTVDSECPGGTCLHQCFCAGQVQPNQCDDACVGGANDAAPCDTDAECPGGICHPFDCREDPMDMDSDQEGICTTGPTQGLCSITTYKGCDDDLECAPPSCTFCQPAETCVFKNKACFVNSGITRTGSPGFPNRTVASVYCVPPNSGAINASAGFGGPGALIQHETLLVVP